MRAAFLLLVLPVLAGCDSVDPQSAFDIRGDEFEVLQEAIDDRSVTRADALPTTGAANYDGIMALEARIDGAQTEMLGDLALAVSFADDSIVGTAGSFYTPSNQVVGGALTITNGEIDRDAPTSSPTFDGDLGGRLTSPGGDDLTVLGEIEGNFYGAGASHAGGEVDAFVTDGTTTSTLDGRFAARR